ncbi:hypothetical protein DRQ36_05715 [bacterium]|nr:MAG: hypothetical protein DRQ36_05715 [bacterium]
MKIPIGVFMIGVLLFSVATAGELEHGDVDFWKDGTFHQGSVEVSGDGTGIIRARVDGEWGEFEPVELPESFLKWNFGARIEMIEGMKNGIMPTSMAGPHNASVATFGTKRNDSHFKINNAVKGTGFLPKPDKIKGVIAHLKETMDSPMPEKLDVLLENYNLGEELFDITKQASLELYTTPEFETGTFLNQMQNPGCSLVYMDIPSYELKCVAQLLHPADPKLTDYEKDVVEYINLVHSYFHGEFRTAFIAVIYHVVEVYDNSPASRGIRLVPSP